MGNAPYKLLYEEDPDLPLKIDKPYYLKVIKNKSEMTGWERVKNLFETDSFGEFTPELMNCKNAMLVSLFAGGFVGGIARSRTAYQDFFRSYAHEKFESPMRAKMLLQEKVLVSFGTGMWRVGWRLTVFTGLLMTGSTIISAYRGNNGLLEQAAGGSVAGILYKFREGPKPAIAGGIFGGALGVVAWFSYTALFAISGVNYDTLMAFEYQRRAMASEKKLKKYHEARMDQDRIHSLSQFQDSMVDNPKSPIQNQTSKESSSNSSNNNVVNVTPVQVSKQLQNS